MLPAEEDQGPYCGATLVICPLVAVIQWRSEIARYTAPGALKVQKEVLQKEVQQYLRTVPAMPASSAVPQGTAGQSAAQVVHADALASAPVISKHGMHCQVSGSLHTGFPMNAQG